MVSNIPSSSSETSSIQMRPYIATDYTFLLSLAPRLTIGIAPWRSVESMQAAMERFIRNSIEKHPERIMIFVAEDEQGRQLGFASVAHERNFTGEAQAYIGELAIREDCEGYGVGRALVEACEQWARDNHYTVLVLETGIANERARSFYRNLNFQEESIKLAKPL